jgi:hypothetical protein
MKFLGPCNEVQVRQTVNKFRPPILRHATQDTEDEVWVLTLSPGKMPCLSDSFLLRLVSNAARIKQDYVRIVLMLNDGITTVAQVTGDLLGVTLIHLASVGLDVDAVHWGAVFIEKGEKARNGGWGVNLKGSAQSQPDSVIASKAG